MAIFNQWMRAHAATRRRWAAMAMLAALMAAGCSEPASTSRPSPAFSLGRRQIALPSGNTLLFEGELPIIQRLGTGGPVRLYDRTDRTNIWSGELPPNGLMVIDTIGVTVESRHLLNRGLNPQHWYELWFEPKTP